MPHSFWTVRPRIVDAQGTNTVAMPDMGGAQYRTTVPGDLMVADGPHKHTIIGGNFGAPSVGFAHYHWFVRKPNGQIEQITIGAAHHVHTSDIDANSRILPELYLLLVTCDDAAYVTLTGAGWLVLAERPWEDESFGGLSTDTWTAGKRTAAENKVEGALGLQLPAIVDTDKEFIVWLLDVGAYRYEDEAKHE